ncbi:MAG TPA: hypothetical protein VFZ00_13730 [Solirubrobacter sp.]|nr:hypothetical protein [Solirubrobacter sp.]
MASWNLRRVGSRLIVGVLAACTLGLLNWQLRDSAADSTARTSGTAASEHRYSVFARPADPNDSVADWDIPANPRIGLDISGARIVESRPERQVAAVPAAKAPCLVTRFTGGSRGVSCAMEPGQTPALVTHDGAVGLVPDGVQTVTFTMSNGSTIADRVVDNVWKSPVEATAVSFTIDGAEQQVQLMARSSLPEGAAIGADGIVSGGTAPPEPR